MIAFARENRSSDNNLDCLRYYLVTLGNCCQVFKKTKYREFSNNGIELADRFMDEGLNLSVNAYTGNIDGENFIGIFAEFPSLNLYPYIRYDMDSNDYCYPEDPCSAYSLVINLIRKGNATRTHEKALGEMILTMVTDKGKVRDKRMLDPLDVNFSKRILGKYLRNGYSNLH